MKSSSGFKRMIMTLVVVQSFLWLGHLGFGETVNSRMAVVPMSANDIRPLNIGSRIPSLTLKTVDGKEFSLDNAISKKPTVLIFYRGGWCPFCNMQLSELRKVEPALIDLGYQLIAISADKPASLAKSIEKHQLHYLLLSDNKMIAARSFGIAFKVDDQALQRYNQHGVDLEAWSGENHHMLPVPAAFVLGTDATIKFEYVNPDFRVRVDPDVLLAAARAALKKKP